MNISALFINRPVMTTLLTGGLVIFGLMSFPKLAVNDLPNVDFPVVTVSASLPGASPETMASSVATPLEKKFSSIPGLDLMTSSSALGNMTITLQFKLERNIDDAAQDVQSAISQAIKQLPASLTTPPSYRKVNPSDLPIMYLSLCSRTLPMSMLDHYAQTLISQRLSTLNGVAEIQVYGSQKYAVRIQLDPQLLSAWQLGIDEVQDAIAKANVNQPTGALDGRNISLTIQADGQLFNADAYKRIVLCYRNGAPVRLQDVASVYDSVENNKTAAWYTSGKDQQRAIVLAVMRQPGANTVAVAGEINKVLPELTRQLPSSVQLVKLYDRSETIQSSIFDVEFTMLLTLVLVILVIFLFLRNVRATVIPSLTLPMSILGTFIVMYLLGFSLDNLSLMALTLAIGFVVDDAIVMLENIFRHLEMGKPVKQAALDGSGEIGFTILSMTLSLAAVFIPVLFMAGVVGRFFREFGVVIAAAVLVSGVVSLTLIPMLASKFLRPHEAAAGAKAAEATPGGRWTLWYGAILRRVIGHWQWMIVFSALVLGATVLLFFLIPKGFLPEEDQNLLRGKTEAVQGISFEALSRQQQLVGMIISQDPDVEALMASCGASGGNVAGNTGNLMIRLKPRDQRRRSAEKILVGLKSRLAAVPGIQTYLMLPPAINIGGRSSKAQYQYTLIGSDGDELRRVASKAETVLRQMNCVEDVNSDLQIANPQLNMRINRDKAALLEVPVATIETALYNAFGPNDISTIYGDDDQYSVLLELKDAFRSDRNAVDLLYVRSDRNALVPLSDLVVMSKTAGVLTVNHSGQLPSVTISFNVKPGYALSDAVNQIEKDIAPLLPVSVSASFQGTAQAFKDSTSGMLLLLAVTILVIYIILGILYEDYWHPVTILTALPFAGFGALLSLMVCRIDLSLYGFIGIIMLVGIVKKNGIMMVDFAITAQRERGLSPSEAIIQACLVRFRPIMMTTAAAIMAGIPIAVGWGGGGESRQPLGVSIVGGLLFSQLLTLFVTPSIYVCLEHLRRRHADAMEPSGQRIPSTS
ncbi:MAG: Multidrug resistance protein MdtB [Lentisphaerae bacterium ADurb.Bin242]|nr:MAG: Multidrug resistance protein MdtB [Lentisphaerae bacterium ADurb.Bin242]